MSRPNPELVPTYYVKYIDSVKEANIQDALTNSIEHFTKQLALISEDKAEYRYAEGKWSVKEVIQHIIDTERIFNYRALCIARGESNALPGFNENHYARNSHASLRRFEDLKEEFLTVRASTAALYNSFTEEDLRATGNANGHEVEVLLIGYVTVGHALHHMNIIKERYL